MNGISIIIPIDESRLPQFITAWGMFSKVTMPRQTEVMLVSRTLKKVPDDLPDSVRGHFKLIKYEHKGHYFNPSLALNLGVAASQYNNIVITCPEVAPHKGDPFDYIASLDRGNYVFKCFDSNKEGKLSELVSTKYRSRDPAMYFFALFKKEDLEAINGWDLEFMNGYAWEDTDFGKRFIRAGLSFTVIDDIALVHLYHPRGNALNEGWKINQKQVQQNDANNIIKCKRGLMEVVDVR